VTVWAGRFPEGSRRSSGRRPGTAIAGGNAPGGRTSDDLKAESLAHAPVRPFQGRDRAARRPPGALPPATAVLALRARPQGPPEVSQTRKTAVNAGTGGAPDGGLLRAATARPLRRAAMSRVRERTNSHHRFPPGAALFPRVSPTSRGVHPCGRTEKDVTPNEPPGVSCCRAIGLAGHPPE